MFSKVLFYFWLWNLIVAINLLPYLIEAQDFCFAQCKYYLVFSKGKKTTYNNYKCIMSKQWMNKAIRKGSTWERTKKVIPYLRFIFISSCILNAIW